jgi:oligopeptidase B
MLRLRSALLFGAVLVASCAKTVTPEPTATSEVTMRAPDAEQRPYSHTEHGVERPDPYHWMRDREDPALIPYLEAENAYTEAQTAHLADLRKSLFDEMLGRIQEDDDTPPVKRGEYWYYTRTEAGKAYRIHCRKKGSVDAPEEIILDENALAEGKEYIDFSGLSVSPDHTILAYATDETGRELYDVHFKDLTTGELLPDTIKDIWPNLAWSTDNKTLFYTRLDDSLRPHQVVRHELGATGDDAVVYEETDSRYRVGIGRTRDDRWLLMTSDSASTTEVRYWPADEPTAEATVFSPRHEGHEYSVNSLGDRFLVVTNDSDDAEGKHDDGALGFKLMEASVGKTDRKDWTEVVPARDGVTLQGIDVFETHYVLWEREGGQSYMRYVALDGSADRRLEMPEGVYVLGGASNPEYDATSYRFTYTSLTTPSTTYEVALPSGELTMLKQQVVVGGYDPSLYTSTRLYATSHDGVKVPISVVHRKDTALDGTAPAMLYGYGSYGITVEPRFSSVRLSLLDRGIVFAIAHPRGGGFLGREWKDTGKFEHKQNTFSDFIAAGRHLVAEGYTSHERMAIRGGSAGGLLIGAVINQAPDLAHAAVAQVPFVDVVSTMMDETIPLTTNEWEEWGNPQEKPWFDVMLAYSPYDNVREGAYPNLLITSGLNDPRVQYWEPTKWVARLRDRVTSDTDLLLKMEMGSGHGGKSGRYGYLEDLAFVYAWLFQHWGIDR